MDNIVIKSVDKGGGIILLDKTDYLKEAYRLVSDATTYHKLHKDPMRDFAKEAEALIHNALQEGIITKTESSFLQKTFYKIPYFYYLPKIHKNSQQPQEDPS